MSVTLELKPEIEQRVVEQVASRGAPVKHLSESLIEKEFEQEERPKFLSSAGRVGSRARLIC
jgi:hypothetical protein